MFIVYHLYYLRQKNLACLKERNEKETGDWEIFCTEKWTGVGVGAVLFRSRSSALLGFSFRLNALCLFDSGSISNVLLQRLLSLYLRSGSAFAKHAAPIGTNVIHAKLRRRTSIAGYQWSTCNHFSA
jgi:hypothetical protein